MCGYGEITSLGTGCCTFTVSLVLSVGVWLGGDYYLGYWVLYIHCISGPVFRCVVRGRLLPGVLPALDSRESGAVLRSSGSDA